MSDHADTIRAAIEFISIDDAQRETVEAMKALLAYSTEAGRQIASLSVDRQEAIDALREIADVGGRDDRATKIARAALVKIIGETQ